MLYPLTEGLRALRANQASSRLMRGTIVKIALLGNMATINNPTINNPILSLSAKIVKPEDMKYRRGKLRALHAWPERFQIKLANLLKVLAKFAQPVAPPKTKMASMPLPTTLLAPTVP